MQSIADFVKEQGITMIAGAVSSNPNMADAHAGMHHYGCDFTHGSGRTMTVTFSMGAALQGPPTAEDVLNCLASDASGVENSKDFEDWCGDYGYDTDSRKAEATYNACVEQANELKEMLGEEAYKALLWETERQ